MNKLGHLILGIALSFTFVFLTNYLGLGLFSLSFRFLIIAVLVICFYSLLPDIDHANGTTHKWFFGFGIIGLVIGVLGIYFRFEFLNSFFLISLSTIILTFIFLATNFFKHRGFIHSVPAGIIGTIPLYFLFSNLAYCILGYVAWHSHLLGDGYLCKMK